MIEVHRDDAPGLARKCISNLWSMPDKTAARFFLALIAVTSLALAIIAAPVAKEVLVAGVLASVLSPLHQWLTSRLWGRRGVAAGLMMILVLVTILGPLAGLVTFVAREGTSGLRFVADVLQSDRVTETVRKLPKPIRDAANTGIRDMPRSLGEIVGGSSKASERTAAAVGTAATVLGSFAVSTALTLIALFFFLVHGREILGWLDEASPLEPGQTHELFTEVKNMSRAVIVSAAVTAGVQAMAALAGFLIAGVPSPVFFMLITFFLALIPAIGAAVVCIAAALLLLATGKPGMAIFLAAWGMVVVGLADNLVRPLVIQRGMKIDGAVVFFALIGGLAAFGAAGLLIGPLVVAFFLALMRMHHRDFSPRARAAMASAHATEEMAELQQKALGEKPQATAKSRDDGGSPSRT